MPPPRKYPRREANLGALIEKLEAMQEELGDKGVPCRCCHLHVLFTNILTS